MSRKSETKNFCFGNFYFQDFELKKKIIYNSVENRSQVLNLWFLIEISMEEMELVVVGKINWIVERSWCDENLLELSECHKFDAKVKTKCLAIVCPFAKGKFSMDALHGEIIPVVTEKMRLKMKTNQSY